MVEIGKFRGDPVYARAAVISLKTAENWMRIGRKVKPGCQPLKWVKPRAATVNKRREIEMALKMGSLTPADDSAGEDVMQGLYALDQTELYKPEPVVDVRVLRDILACVRLIPNARRRERYPRTGLAISTSMYLRCCRQEPYIFLVSAFPVS